MSEPTDALAAQPDAAPAVQMSTAAYSRLKPMQMHLILQLHADGRLQQDIADIVGCHISTVSRFLKQIGDPHKVIQQVMQGDTLAALTDWKVARRKAAKRGDHRPAREWVEAAYPDLRPQPVASAGGGGVVINIGMPGQPLEPPVIALSPQRPALESETDSNR